MFPRSAMAGSRYIAVQTWTEWREVRELDTKSWMDRKWIQGWREREERKWEEITRPPHVYILGPGPPFYR